MSVSNFYNDVTPNAHTGEIEIMEFRVAGEIFGIDVAKVREIMVSCDVKPMQKSHPCVEGVFKSRDAVITVLDLARYLGLPPSEDSERDIFIISTFGGSTFAFHAHTVDSIDRIPHQQIRTPDRVIYGGGEGIATGIADYEGRLITILDFEKIIAEVSPEPDSLPEVAAVS